METRLSQGDFNFAPTQIGPQFKVSVVNLSVYNSVYVEWSLIISASDQYARNTRRRGVKFEKNVDDTLK
jgi:hypothetical protein